jgi:AraC family transcriptional regulator
MRHLAPRESFGRCARPIDVGGALVRDTHLGPDAVLPRHEHAAAYVCIVLDGDYLERAGCAATDARCAAGSVVMHPAGHVHENRVGDHGARCVNVELDRDALRDGPLHALGRLLDDERHVALPSTLPALRRFADALHDAEARPDDLADLHVHAATLDVLCTVARTPARADASATRAAALARVIDCLEADLAAPPAIDDLAALAGLHPHHFMRVFRARHGETIGAYVRRRRLEQADARLREDDTPLVDIALEAGFCDQSHFTRAYRLHFGWTPGERRVGARR